MFKVSNFLDNDDIKIIDEKGAFKVLEYQRDLSVTPAEAVQQYYMEQMNVKRRQVVCDVKKSSITLQAGAMQWTLGNVKATTGVKSVGDFAGKMFKGAATGESAIKPEYTGDGMLVLEPTFKHVILLDVADWNGALVLDDGLFLASEASLKHTLTSRKNVSSAVLGGEGLFNLCLKGKGIVALESRTPLEELILVELHDDELKLDGNFAVAWSDTLSFTTERSGKSLLGSAASGEGLVNVYRGTGKVLLAPVLR